MNRTSALTLATLLGLGLGLAGSARADDCASGKSAEKAATADIVDTAVSAGSFDTLVAAVKAAGLVETLKGEGPYTVFAPSDEAFAKVPEADLQALLADPETLRAVLTHHVVAGRITAADLGDVTEARTVHGTSLAIETGDGVTVDGARVVQADVETSNGIIHVIDTVVFPTSG